jgi:hypothetical protein
MEAGQAIRPGCLPQPIHLSRTVSPQGDALCPPGLAACSTTASTWRHSGKGWSHVVHTQQWTTRPRHTVVTSGGDGKATAHTTVPTRPNSMHVTKSAPAEASDRKGPEAALIFIGLSRRHFFQHVRVETFERLQDEVVLKRSTHAPASQPRRMWRATVANGQSISIGGQNNTGEHLSSKRPAKIKQLLLGRVPLKTRRTTSEASSTAPPTASVNPCNRPRAKSVKSRAEVSSNGEVQATDRRPDVQHLDQPDTLLRCHLCP